MPLGEVVLGPLVHGGDGQLVGVRRRGHHERQVRGHLPQAADRVQAEAVGQRQVGDDHVRNGLGEGVGGGSQAGDDDAVERTAARVGEHLEQEPGVGLVVLDDQQVHGREASTSGSRKEIMVPG